MIYAIDLDGVLSDFVGGAAKVFDIDLTKIDWPPGLYNIAKVFNIIETSFWRKLTGAEFWETLEKTDFADALLGMLGGEQFIITSPTLDPMCLSGKYIWIKHNYPELARKFLIGPCKEYCARPDICLVDDSDYNVDKFRRHGGKAILVPQPWNSAHAHVNDRLTYIQKFL